MSAPSGFHCYRTESQISAFGSNGNEVIWWSRHLSLPHIHAQGASMTGLVLRVVIVTLGLFLLVINAAMLGLVALLLGGFQISGFWTALGASVIVSVTSWIASGL